MPERVRRGRLAARSNVVRVDAVQRRASREPDALTVTRAAASVETTEAGMAWSICEGRRGDPPSAECTRFEVVAEERITYLNLAALNRKHLFESARSLVGTDEPRGPALVVAQAAVEVGVETAIDFALRLRDVHDPLREWVRASVNSWSPVNENVQGLWTALTGDKIAQVPDWAAYREAEQLRALGCGCVGGAG